MPTRAITDDCPLQITRLWDCDASAAQAEAQRLERLAGYALDRHEDSLGTLTRLWAGIEPLIRRLEREARRLVEEHLGHAHSAARDHFLTRETGSTDGLPERSSTWESKAAGMVPRRAYRGPAAFHRMERKSPEADRVAWSAFVRTRPAGGYTLPVLAEYWADGKRTALEIVYLVELESGIRDAELVVRRFELMHKLGLVALKSD